MGGEGLLEGVVDLNHLASRQTHLRIGIAIVGGFELVLDVVGVAKLLDRELAGQGQVPLAGGFVVIVGGEGDVDRLRRLAVDLDEGLNLRKAKVIGSGEADGDRLVDRGGDLLRR